MKESNPLIKALSNHELLVSVRHAVKVEKQALVQVLEHLIEIDNRRLHVDRGFHSLHEFLVKELGYCDGSAHRRIASMRLMREIPDVKAQILNSKLTLTNLAEASLFFRAEQKLNTASLSSSGNYSSKEEKLKVLDQLAGKSKQQAKEILYALSTHPQKEQKIEFIADSELISLIKELKALEGELPIKEVVRRALKSHIQMIQKKRKGPVRASLEKLSKTNSTPTKPINSTNLRQAAQSQSPSPNLKQSQSPIPSPNPQPSPPPASSEKFQSNQHRPHIPSQIQRQVHAASQHQCSFIDSLSKRRCTKKHNLEIEHRIPIAKGGSNHPENLTLLCKAHNRLQAFRHFGKLKMSHHYPAQ